MRLLLTSALLAVAALAAPLAPAAALDPEVHTPTNPIAAAYTADITPSRSEPPPVWDPVIPRPPPLFEAPVEDLPSVPYSLDSVHRAPVQSVRLEKLIPFTGSTQQPAENIYRASANDPESKFNGEGSLRPARMTLAGCAFAFVRTWIWWIGVVVAACVIVYIAEKMLIGAIIGARRARSASRAARSRAASLVATMSPRSRAASLVASPGRGRAGTMSFFTEKLRLERSRSPPMRTRSWDDSMV